MSLLFQAPKKVPEAVKQGVETPQDKGKKGKKGGSAAAAPDASSSATASASKAKSNPQFEAFIRRVRGGK